MYEKIDKRITEHAKKSDVPLIENYHAHVNLLLNNLPETRKKVIKISAWQRTAATIVVCLLSISSGVLAANYVVSERLQNMPDAEVERYRLNEQKTDANADSYSRALAEEEKGRLAELRNAYTTEGEFPVSQLPTVVGVEDIEVDQMCYVMTDSLFYFPDRELKDEELLQYIDFCTKRDYSIAQTWQESMEAQEKLEKSLSSWDASQAIQRSIDLVQKTFGVDVSGYEYSLELLNESAGKSEGLFILRLKRDGVVSYITSIDAEKEDFSILFVGDNVNSAEIQINEDAYKDNYEAIRGLLEKSFNIHGSDIKETLLIYEKSNSNMLIDGIITYFVKLNDDTRYVLQYSVDNWECLNVDFSKEYSSYASLLESQVLTAEMMNNTLCVISLENE